MNPYSLEYNPHCDSNYYNNYTSVQSHGYDYNGYTAYQAPLPQQPALLPPQQQVALAPPTSYIPVSSDYVPPYDHISNPYNGYTSVVEQSYGCTDFYQYNYELSNVPPPCTGNPEQMPSQSTEYHRHYLSAPKPEDKKDVKIRLPSPDSFIRECKSGRKSTERRSNEEIIKYALRIEKDGKPAEVKRFKESPCSVDNEHHSAKRNESVSKEEYASCKRSSSMYSNKSVKRKPPHPSSSAKRQRNDDFLKKWR